MPREFWLGLFYGCLATALVALTAFGYMAHRRVQQAMREHPATLCKRGYARGKCSWPACACGVELGRWPTGWTHKCLFSTGTVWLARGVSCTNCGATDAAPTADSSVTGDQMAQGKDGGEHV